MTSVTVRCCLLFFGFAMPPMTAIAETMEVTVRVVDAQGEPVEDAVVCMFPVDGPMPVVEAASVTVIQKDLTFEPFVSVAQTGAELILPNHDDVLHHVYSLSATKMFDIPLYGGDEAGRVALDQTGIITLGCNIHDTMIAHVYVTDAPWSAVTDEEGWIRIPGVSPGRYRHEIWHPRLEGDPVTAEFQAGEVLSVTVSLRKERRIRRPSKGGYRR